jgi:hypothetical protein
MTYLLKIWAGTFLVLLASSLNCLAGVPCDLQKIRKRNHGTLPQLLISGENHSSRSCIADRVFHEKNQSHILSLMEGHLKSFDLRGIEDPVAMHFLQLRRNKFPKYYHTPKSNRQILKEALVSFNVSYENFASLNATTQFLKKNRIHSEADQKALQNFESHLTAFSYISIEGLKKPLATRLLFISEDFSDLLAGQFTDQLVVQIVSKLRRRLPDDAKYLIPDCKSLGEAACLEAVGEDFFDDIFTLDVRNFFMAENIAQAYCKNALTEKLPVIVTVGSCE